MPHQGDNPWKLFLAFLSKDGFQKAKPVSWSQYNIIDLQTLDVALRDGLFSEKLMIEGLKRHGSDSLIVNFDIVPLVFGLSHWKSPVFLIVDHHSRMAHHFDFRQLKLSFSEFHNYIGSVGYLRHCQDIDLFSDLTFAFLEREGLDVRGVKTDAECGAYLAE